MSGTRMAPQYCPYCGDIDLRPDDRGHTAWECRSCLRIFTLAVVGVAS